MLLLATPWPDGSPVSTDQAWEPSARLRARARLLPTISTLPANTPPMYWSSSPFWTAHSLEPSLRLTQWTALASGAVKTTLPSVMTGAATFQSVGLLPSWLTPGWG